jgi:hypothetical protein
LETNGMPGPVMPLENAELPSAATNHTCNYDQCQAFGCADKCSIDHPRSSNEPTRYAARERCGSPHTWRLYKISYLYHYRPPHTYCHH